MFDLFKYFFGLKITESAETLFSNHKICVGAISWNITQFTAQIYSRSFIHAWYLVRTKTINCHFRRFAISSRWSIDEENTEKYASLSCLPWECENFNFKGRNAWSLKNRLEEVEMVESLLYHTEVPWSWMESLRTTLVSYKQTLQHFWCSYLACCMALRVANAVKWGYNVPCVIMYGIVCVKLAAMRT
jgi:hypothetical protein